MFVQVHGVQTLDPDDDEIVTWYLKDLDPNQFINYDIKHLGEDEVEEGRTSEWDAIQNEVDVESIGHTEGYPEGEHEHNSNVNIQSNTLDVSSSYF